MMTGCLHEKEFSRKIVREGRRRADRRLQPRRQGRARPKAATAVDPFASPGPADPNSVDSFLTIHADNTASLNSGRINLGQQSTTGLMLIAAEELDMDFTQFRHIEFDTGGAHPSPNTGNTGGSPRSPREARSSAARRPRRSRRCSPWPRRTSACPSRA